MTANGYTGNTPGGGGGTGAVDSVNGRTGAVTLTKTDVGLASVDNTADTAKPVSTAQAAADALKISGPASAVSGNLVSYSGTTGKLAADSGISGTTLTAQIVDLYASKANLASPTFTGTVAGVTAAMVGLGSVDNTADTAKPVSTAQQTALNLKANLASPTFTGTVAGITKTMVGLGNVDNTADTAKTFTESQVTNLVTDLAAKQAIIKLWNGSAYAAATGAEIYVGGTPSSPADGSIWFP